MLENSTWNDTGRVEQAGRRAAERHSSGNVTVCTSAISLHVVLK